MPSKKRSDSLVEPCRAAPRRAGRRKRLQSMGVRLSETNPEMRTATPMVTANSWSNRPTMPPMKSTGMKTATRESVMEMMVKLISLDR